MRELVCAVTGVLVLACALVAVNAPDDARADASLEHWTGDLCTSVVTWLQTANAAPDPDPTGDQQLAVRRYLSNLVQETHSLIGVSVRYPPPVSGGRKLRARIDRTIDDAVGEFEHAGKLLARPTLSQAIVRSAVRHLGAGYDEIVTMMQQLRGHSGNRRFNRAMRRNPFCDYVPQLTTSGSSSEA
jgi:hypothetical protein